MVSYGKLERVIGNFKEFCEDLGGSKSDIVVTKDYVETYCLFQNPLKVSKIHTIEENNRASVIVYHDYNTKTTEFEMETNEYGLIVKAVNIRGDFITWHNVRKGESRSGITTHYQTYNVDRIVFRCSELLGGEKACTMEFVGEMGY